MLMLIQAIKRGANSWRAETGGNFAVMFALLAPLVLGLAGGAVDFGRHQALTAELQEIADTAALGGARQYGLAATPSAGEATASAVATTLANKLINNFPLGVGATPQATPNAVDRSVSVTITKSFEPTFMVGVFKRPITVEVEAVAIAEAAGKTCVIAMEETDNNAIDMNNSARLSGDACGVFANSTHNNAIDASGTAEIVADLICSAGGAAGGNARYTPDPLTDCPTKEDPLADRALPADAACSDPNPTVITDQTMTINPGVYCGLTINGASDVTFSAGVYVIRDNDFLVDDAAEITGNGVTIHFGSGDPAMHIASGTTVSLTAPTSGDTAGVLVSQNRDTHPQTEYRISSNNADTLVGTIYLPRGKFVVDSTTPVAGASAYTAIIARMVKIEGSANLVLNSNYTATSVPVPPGLSGGADVRLRL